MAEHITVLDGGIGRELMRMGAPFRQPEWSALALIEAPEAVSQAHAAFIAAGADVITANAYAVVPYHIGADRFDKEGPSLAARAGQLARTAAEAAASAVRVAGCLPPLCGSYRPDLFDAANAVRTLATLIAAQGPYVDLWLGETLSSIAEAEAIGAALSGDARPLWLSFTLADDDPTTPRLRSQEAVADVVATAVALGARAVLFNCCRPEAMGPALDEARRALRDCKGDVATGAYANAFQPRPEGAEANSDILRLRTDLDPPGYLGFARDWVARGATIIGGCCGIGPEHIAALRPAFVVPQT